MEKKPVPLDKNDLVRKYGWLKVIAGALLFLLWVAATVSCVVYAHEFAKRKGTAAVIALALLGGTMTALGGKLSDGAKLKE